MMGGVGVYQKHPFFFSFVEHSPLDKYREKARIIMLQNYFIRRFTNIKSTGCIKKNGT